MPDEREPGAALETMAGEMELTGAIESDIDGATVTSEMEAEQDAGGEAPEASTAESGLEAEDTADDADIELDEVGRARVPSWVADAEPEDLAIVVEAVCFALNRPVSLVEVGSIVGRPAAVIAAAADALTAELRDRGDGLMLQRHGEQIQLVTRPEVAWAVQRALNPERAGRLSRPALETLAIVAYRQPVTRGTLEAIRGVNCDAVLESLERRGLISEIGRADSPGHPRLFGTTLRFLQMVGLERIEQLPPLPEGMTVPDFDDEAWAGALEDSAGALDRDAAIGGDEPAGEASLDGVAAEPGTEPRAPEL